MSSIPKPKKINVIAPRTTLPTREQWSEIIQKQFQSFRRVIRDAGEGRVSPECLDMTDTMLKRRRKAVLNTLPELYQHITAPEQDLPLPGEEWAEMSLSLSTCSILDESTHLLYAASIWVLDQIMTQDNWRQIYALLPEDGSVLEDLLDHSFWHCRYEEDLICSVEYVLRSRNPLEKDGDGTDRVFTSELQARGKRGQGLNRDRYDHLIAMIPPRAIQGAVKRFRHQFWQWVEGYFRTIQPFFNGAVADTEALRQAQTAYNRYLDPFLAGLRQGAKRTRRPRPVAPLAKQPDFDPLNLRSSLPGSVPQLPGLPNADPELDRMIHLTAQMDRALGDAEAAEARLNSNHGFRRKFSSQLTSAGRTQVDYDCGPYVISPIEHMDVGDPYEMCFALLYLADTDDDLAWLYGPCCGLMQEVADALPWGIRQYSDIEDQVWDGEKPFWFAAGLPKSIKIPDMYQRSYRKRGEELNPRNLSQIVFEETGCILPRNLQLYNQLAPKLSSYGIRGKDAANLLMLMSLAAGSNRSVCALNLEEDYRARFEAAEDQIQEEEPTPEEVDADALKAEIKRLKTALHSAEKESRETKKALNTIQSRAEQERRELADLREYVFRQAEGAEEQAEPEPPAGPDWPYQVRRDTVIFGGHATWSKGIRSILTGNIRFVDKNMLFDTGLIKHAEVIWVQPNALSHPMYWRVVDTARTYGKPVRYFQFASWAKCAEQVREEDGRRR